MQLLLIDPRALARECNVVEQIFDLRRSRPFFDLVYNFLFSLKKLIFVFLTQIWGDFD